MIRAKQAMYDAFMSYNSNPSELNKEILHRAAVAWGELQIH